jgi:hypothetical protein
MSLYKTNDQHSAVSDIPCATFSLSVDDPVAAKQ